MLIPASCVFLTSFYFKKYLPHLCLFLTSLNILIHQMEARIKYLKYTYERILFCFRKAIENTCNGKLTKYTVFGHLQSFMFSVLSKPHPPPPPPPPRQWGLFLGWNLGCLRIKFVLQSFDKGAVTNWRICQTFARRIEKLVKSAMVINNTLLTHSSSIAYTLCKSLYVWL